MNHSQDMNGQCRVNIEDTAKAKPKEAGDANARPIPNQEVVQRVRVMYSNHSAEQPKAVSAQSGMHKEMYEHHGMEQQS